MAATHESWSISRIDTSGQARVHIGHNHEYHEHRHYADESQLSPTERQRAREDAVLSSVYFTDMSARERAIDSPCDDTFGWIFDEQVTERKQNEEKHIRNLMSRWLEHEHGMFFIVGKAGSGKSTLMRFLAGHKNTRKLLHSWAERHGCALTVHAHYFWCSGSQLQSSQEGLWRNILYAIAKEDRKLASAMFAKRAGDGCQTLAQLRGQPWAREELINALLLLVGQLEVQKVVVCLFIDGLDEFQGDEMMLIGELRQLLRSPCIKICASSRPRNLFEGAFGYEDYQWKLALHLLTRGDMVRLASTRLYDDYAFCKLVDCEHLRQDFVTAITDRSQGVFLWTVLVVREMIRESHQAGTIDELKARLDALPIELGGERGMYQRIFERSDPRYRKYMARLLLVMLEADLASVYWGDVHFLYYDARDAAFATRECLGLDDKYRLAWDKKAEEAISQSSHWEAEDNDTSCRGLFLACHEGRSEAHPRGVNCGIHRIRLNEDTRQQVRKWCPDFVDTNERILLSFLHRSVGEYLSLPKIHEQMTDLAGHGFDPVLTKCHLRLARSRLQSHSWDRETVRMLACVGNERREYVRSILPEFERIQNTKWSLIPVKEREGRILYGHWAKILCCTGAHEHFLHGSFDISRNSQAHAWFLSLVAIEGCMWYCRERWSQVPTSERQAAGTIIIASLAFNTISLEMSRENAALIQSLLCSGVDVNKEYTWMKMFGARRFKASLWEAYVEAFSSGWQSGLDADLPWKLEVLQLLLQDGRADRKCCLPAGKKSLLSALTFEPREEGVSRDRQNHRWIMFAGRLHNLLDAHGLLTPEERHIALEQGWISQSATEPHVRRFSRWLRKLKR